MKSFGEWLADSYRPTVVAEYDLPAGVYDHGDGEYRANCCCCAKSCDVTEHIEDIKKSKTPYEHYCGSGPSCCP